jgi:hypothetical protein
MTRIHAYPLRPALAAGLLIVQGACAGVPAGQDDEPIDIDDPVLIVESPARGKMGENGNVVVSGTATDEGLGIESVTVNGQPAELAPDGTFSARLSLPEGMSFIETIATDRAGNSVNDIRAALTGQFEMLSEPVANAFVARVNESSFGALENMVVDLADGTDFGEVAQPYNPVVDVGGSCLGSQIDVQSIEKSGVAMQIRPTAAGIEIEVDIQDVDADLVSHHHVACIAGTAPIRLDADHFYITGRLEVDLDVFNGFDVSLVGLQGTFEGFRLGVASLPEQITNLVRDPVKNYVRDQLLSLVEDMVPSLGESFLADFTGKSFELSLGEDHSFTLSVAPTAVTPREGNLEILIEGQADVPEAVGGAYIATPSAVPSGGGDRGLELYLADDLGNQLLAGVWTGNVLQESLHKGLVEAIEGLFGEQAGDIQLDMMLPPVINSDINAQSVQLMVGDIVVSVNSASDGATLLSFAVSASIDLNLAYDDGLTLITGEPHIYAKLIEKSPLVVLNIDDSTIAAMAEIMIRQLAENSDELLRAIKIPSLGPVELTDPALSAGAGYLQIEASLR